MFQTNYAKTIECYDDQSSGLTLGHGYDPTSEQNIDALNFDLELQYVTKDGARLLRRGEPLVLSAMLSDEDGCYIAEVPEFDMSIAAYSRLDMFESLNDLICMLWEQYAEEDDDNLTPRARSLKAHLLEGYEVVVR